MYRVRQQLHLNDKRINNLDGSGIYALVLDSGITRHPDFNNRIYAFKDFVQGKTSIYDDYGHGTHVSGILCSDGFASGGRYRGVAPKLRIISGKILNYQGEGNTVELIRALEWVKEIKRKVPLRIINISVSLNCNDKKMDVNFSKNLAVARMMLEEYWKDGIFISVAAGNNGPKINSLSGLGQDRYLVCVGCHDGNYIPKHGKLCELYSGRGPGRMEIKKPDIVAPGTDIMSCNSDFGNRRLKNRHPYIQKSGTSMATPIVSGCTALYFQKYPDKSNVEAKARLLQSATNLKEAWTKQGWGMINPVSYLQ